MNSRNSPEETMSENMKFQKALLDASPDMIYVYDLVEKVNIYSNEVIGKILGYTVSEIREMGSDIIPQLMHKDDFKVYIEKTVPLYSTVKDGEYVEHEYRMRHKNETWRKLHSKEMIFKRNEDKSPKQIFGIITDITEQEKKEQELKQLIENINDVVYAVDDKGVLTFVSSVVESVLGYKPEELVGDNIFDYIHKDDVQLVKKGFEDVLNKKNHPSEYRIKRKEKGEYTWVRSSSKAIMEDGKAKGLRGVFSVIENEKKVRNDLNESEEKYTTLLSNVEVGIVLHSSDTSVLLSNQKACEILGLSEDQMKGKKAIDSTWRFVKEDLSDLPLENYPVNMAIKLKNSLVDYVVGVKQSDTKEVKWVNVNAVPVLNDDGRVKYVSISFIDITENKKNLEKLNAKVEELKRFQKLTIGRELKMVELKKHLKEVEGDMNKDEN